jgi:hypothetical protein
MRRTLLLAACLAPIPAGLQDPVPPSKVIAALAEEACGGGEKALAARDRLVNAVAADYALAHAAFRSLPEGKARTLLAHELQLPAIDAAEVVLSGVLQQVEAIQGGVIDYHHVVLTFTSLVVHKASADLRRQIGESKTFAVLRGTSQESWLASVLVRDLRHTTGVHTFAFRRRELKGALPGGEARAFELHEYSLLPAAAGAVAGRGD